MHKSCKSNSNMLLVSTQHAQLHLLMCNLSMSWLLQLDSPMLAGYVLSAQAHSAARRCQHRYYMGWSCNCDVSILTGRTRRSRQRSQSLPTCSGCPWKNTPAKQQQHVCHAWRRVSWRNVQLLNRQVPNGWLVIADRVGHQNGSHMHLTACSLICSPAMSCHQSRWGRCSQTG